MRRWTWLTLCLIMAVPATAGTVDSLLVPAKQFPLAGHVYVVDPGHGGSDAGTKRTDHGRVWNEKQFTLGLSIELATQIRDAGGTVIVTVLIPDSLQYLPFGQNQIPATGAEYFNLTGQPTIQSGLTGLSRRLEIGQVVLERYPAKEVHWLSVHFDFVRVRKGKDAVSGTRLIYSASQQETTFVQVTRFVRHQPVTRDSIVSIAPPVFVQDLAQAFTSAGWLRISEQQPVVASGQKGIRHLFVLRGETDPKSFRIRLSRGRHQKIRTISHAPYNHVIDRVLIEYANFKSDDDWNRLQLPAGSLHRLAAITVQGLILHARRDTVIIPSGR